MGPLKKSKPSQAPTDNINTDATAEGTATAACKNSPQILSASPPARSSDQTEPSEADAGADGGAKTASVSSEQKHLGKKPWLGGSWKSKALPVAEVVRESASSGGTVSDRPATTASRDVPSSPVPYLNKSMRRSSKGSVLTASTTKLNVASTQSNDPRPKDALPDPPLPPDPVETAHKGEVDASKQGGDDAKAEQDVQKPLAATAGWRGWWSKPDNQRAASREAKETSESLETSTDEPARTPLPCSTPTEEAPDRGRLGEPSESSTLVAQEPGDEAAASATAQGAQDRGSQSRSWFWFWSNAQNARDDQESSQHDAGAAPENMSKDIPKADEPPSITVTAEAEPQKPQDSQATPPKSSGWVFWSRARVESDTASDAGSTHKEVGELAVSDTPSQSKPEAAQFNQHEENGTAKQPLKDRGRQRVKETTSQAPTPSKTSPTHSPSRKVSKLAQQTRPNLLLPAFNSTYQLAQTPSYWHQLRSYVYGSISEPARLCINPSPPRIKKALAIGIHGYFPAPLVQRVLGQPTGTSIRFANHAAASIEAWTAERGYKCAIEKVALEGEGFIADRVDTLWKLLLNWIEQIREADFILVAAHSQGVPVSVMLVAKLIEFGCVGAARIGICAMAGVNLGPFAEYKFRFVGSLAQELFEFSSPDSTVSKLYEQALEKVVKAEVKIVYVGSIDDQLVPLEVCLNNLFSSKKTRIGQHATYPTNLKPPITARSTSTSIRLLTDATLPAVRHLRNSLAPIHLPRRLRRRPSAHARLHLVPCRLLPAPAQPRHPRPWPDPRAVARARRQPVRR